MNTAECNRAPFDTVLTEQQRKAEQKHLGNHPIRLPFDASAAAEIHTDDPQPSYCQVEHRPPARAHALPNIVAAL
jgi:hypothetical protein